MALGSLPSDLSVRQTYPPNLEIHPRRFLLLTRRLVLLPRRPSSSSSSSVRFVPSFVVFVAVVHRPRGEPPFERGVDRRRLHAQERRPLGLVRKVWIWRLEFRPSRRQLISSREKGRQVEDEEGRNGDEQRCTAPGHRRAGPGCPSTRSTSGWTASWVSSADAGRRRRSRATSFSCRLRLLTDIWRGERACSS